MTAPLDLTKPVQTRDGQPARIVCTDVRGSTRPVIALVDRGPGETIILCRLDGRTRDDQPTGYDPVNVKVP